MCIFFKSTIIVFFLIVFSFHNAFALQIIAPKEGEQVYAGSNLAVIVKPDAGEAWDKVLLGIFPMSHNIFTGEYKEEIKMKLDSLGPIEIAVLAVDKLGQETEIRRKIFVIMPPNAVLQSIMVGEDLMVLYVASPGSSLEDKQRIETDQVSVAGVYSDGVNRLITPSAMGTTYTSSDEQIVNIDSEGNVRAQGIGKAKITVRNGKYSAEVKVVVKPYKQ